MDHLHRYCNPNFIRKKILWDSQKPVCYENFSLQTSLLCMVAITTPNLPVLINLKTSLSPVNCEIMSLQIKFGLQYLVYMFNILVYASIFLS